MNYRYGFMHALIFVVGALTGFTFLYLNFNVFWKETCTIFIPALSVMLAAFYGAKFAYDFQRKKEYQKEEKDNKATALKAVLQITEIVNHLASYEKQIIDPIIGNTEIPTSLKFFALKPTGIEHMKVNIDPYVLTFLSNKEYVNIVPDFALLRSSYYSLLEAISIRSKIHVECQTLISKKYEGTETVLSLSDLEATVGNQNFIQMLDLSSAIFEMVPSLIQNAAALAKKINEALKEKFSGVELVEIDISSHVNREKIHNQSLNEDPQKAHAR